MRAEAKSLGSLQHLRFRLPADGHCAFYLNGKQPTRSSPRCRPQATKGQQSHGCATAAPPACCCIGRLFCWPPVPPVSFWVCMAILSWTTKFDSAISVVHGLGWLWAQPESHHGNQEPAEMCSSKPTKPRCVLPCVLHASPSCTCVVRLVAVFHQTAREPQGYQPRTPCARQSGADLSLV